MIIDALLLLSDAQALTATAFSTNTIDLGTQTVQRDVAVGEKLACNFQVDVAADTTSGDETYTFQLVQSANANLSSPDVLNQIAIARATLVAGYTFELFWPTNEITKRYIGVQYTLGGTTPTLTITAMVQPAILSSLGVPKSYARGYTIS